jgi:hypothetical protein
VDRARGDGPDVDPDPAFVAAERTSLRGTAGPQQGGDGESSAMRRSDLAPRLRHAAAAAGRRRSAAGSGQPAVCRHRQGHVPANHA